MIKELSRRGRISEEVMVKLFNIISTGVEVKFSFLFRKISNVV